MACLQYSFLTVDIFVFCFAVQKSILDREIFTSLSMQLNICGKAAWGFMVLDLLLEKNWSWGFYFTARSFPAWFRLVLRLDRRFILFLVRCKEGGLLFILIAILYVKGYCLFWSLYFQPLCVVFVSWTKICAKIWKVKSYSVNIK